MIEKKRALISVSDKRGIEVFAQKLVDLGWEIISTGGTARLLEKKNIPVTSIEKVTGFPELMDGRVKTLHPKVHAAILGQRDNSKHKQQAKDQEISWIDLVVVNLYPFEKTVEREDVPLAEAIENIDIGGPTMLRSAAKNYSFVTVVTDPDDYPRVLEEIQANGEVSINTREALAVKVFRRTADYDSEIDRFLSKRILNEEILRLQYSEGMPLRYGENSHQKAVFYRDKKVEETSIACAKLLSGKAMSYNNYMDSDAALEAVIELEDQIGVAVIKHTNPCGYATGETVREALERAWAGDPMSAFGSVIACNSPVDMDFAKFLKSKDETHIGYVIQSGQILPQEVPSKFVEVIIAPDFHRDALEYLSETKSLRLLKTGDFNRSNQEKNTYRKITGGMLAMSRDLELWDHFETVTRKTFDKDKKELAKFMVKACKHTKSNAIVIGREYRRGFFQVMGMGAGQPNRVDSLRKLAVTKVLENLEIEYQSLKPKESFETYSQKALGEMVLASDAFFPFDDTVREAAEFGIRYIVQPGGSKRDEDSIRACDELGVSMAFTGMRHFRH